MHASIYTHIHTYTRTNAGESSGEVLFEHPAFAGINGPLAGINGPLAGINGAHEGGLGLVEEVG